MPSNIAEQAQKLKAEMPHIRHENREADAPRLFRLTPHFTMHAEGSVLVESGNTKVICNASVEERVPPFRRGSGQGWITAEYSMLPRSTSTRMQREVSQGKVGGRTAEIQRLIGRSLRSVANMEVMGENTITVDCDVIQADGGTRTAAITGGFVALVLAMRHLGKKVRFKQPPIRNHVAAISVGLIRGNALLDLDYMEDSQADVDLNVVMTDALEVVEVQGTAEETPFTRAQMNAMLDLAEIGIQSHLMAQKEVLGGKLV